MYNIKRFTATLLLLIGVAFFAVTTLRAAEKMDVANVINQADNSRGEEKTSLANKVMAYYHDLQLTDEPMTFTASTPADELNRQLYYWTGEYFYDSQDYDRAIDFASRALPLCRNTEMEADCLNLLALSHFRMSNYTQAADFAKQCYAIDEKTGDPDVMSSSLNTIAGIYIGANQPKEAEEYILKAIDLAKKADNPARMAVLQGMASEIYHALKDDDKALEYINRACEIERQLGRGDKLAVRLTQKASVLNGLKRYAEAEQLLRTVIPQLRDMGDIQSLGIACNKMGTALFYQNKNREAVGYFNEAAAIFTKIGDAANEMHARRGQYECYWDLNPDSAKIALDRFDYLKDSLYSHASAESLARFNAEFGTDWLKKENETQRSLMRWGVVAGIVLLALVVALVWWMMRRRMKMREDALYTIIAELKKREQEHLLKTSIENAHGEDEHSTDEPDTPSTPIVSNEKFLEKLAKVVVDAMHDNNLTIEQIAGEMCVTRGHLNRRVKALTGVTTQQYVLRVRLEHACRLLRHRDNELSVAQVGYECGFDDAASFSRAFRRVYGVSPTQYREAPEG